MNLKQSSHTVFVVLEDTVWDTSLTFLERTGRVANVFRNAVQHEVGSRYMVLCDPHSYCEKGGWG